MRIPLTLCYIFFLIKIISPRVTSKICRIVAGYECAPSNYPYIVSIETMIVYRHICGGSLIGSKWVLSAAHCKEENYQRYVVVAGLSALMYARDFIAEDVIQESEVLEWYVHPEFVEAFLANDVSLLRLKKTIGESPVIKHASLYLEEFPASFEIDCSNSLVIGFGMKDDRNLIGRKKIARRLTCANVSVIPDIKCMFLSHYTQFCAVDKSNLRDSLNPGDSGGPLFCNGKQIGIVSGYWPDKKLNLFVKVYLYKNFIHDVMASTSSKFQRSISCLSFGIFTLKNKLFY